MQNFVAQENKRERDERATEREIEKVKIASEEAKIAQHREIELAKFETKKAKVVADEAKLAQQRELRPKERKSRRMERNLHIRARWN